MNRLSEILNRLSEIPLTRSERESITELATHWMTEPQFADGPFRDVAEVVLRYEATVRALEAEQPVTASDIRRIVRDEVQSAAYEPPDYSGLDG